MWSKWQKRLIFLLALIAMILIKQAIAWLHPQSFIYAGSEISIAYLAIATWFLSRSESFALLLLILCARVWLFSDFYGVVAQFWFVLIAICSILVSHQMHSQRIQEAIVRQRLEDNNRVVPATIHHFGNLVASLSLATKKLDRDLGTGASPVILRQDAVLLGLIAGQCQESIADLLRFDSLSAAFTPTASEIDLIEFCQTAQKTVSQCASDRNLILSFQPDQPAIVIRVDRRLLNVIVLELLGNACKYAPEFGLVRIECGKTRGQWWITIANTGTIPVCDLDRIWKPYQRGKHPGIEGSGLGLHTCLRAAQMLDCELSCRIDNGEVKFNLRAIG